MAPQARVRLPEPGSNLLRPVGIEVAALGREPLVLAGTGATRRSLGQGSHISASADHAMSPGQAVAPAMRGASQRGDHPVRASFCRHPDAVAGYRMPGALTDEPSVKSARTLGTELIRVNPH
jgi:hypothetical protein